ncbi:hypothetical protein BZA05DRAFT_418690 [Tricharina praecox]|uniref:uncharacterized protein n=1 Tax=Tricharina praecox TaxID=43433 RepID=UPI002220F1CD|nr:uncharacterized protein BZA05DRAFT_418690 [Tricharina praecox]KAI5851786.1 hypothetical protein BZA05DRAFT_418690 [Tricharina praecox]
MWPVLWLLPSHRPLCAHHQTLNPTCPATKINRTAEKMGTTITPHPTPNEISKGDIPAEEAAYADYLQILALTALYLLAISEEKDGAAAAEQPMEIDEENEDENEMEIDEDEDEDEGYVEGGEDDMDEEEGVGGES